MGLKLIHQVRKLIEFYFGDGNLSNSSFMKTEMLKSGNNSIRIDVLLTFNKLKSLTTDVDLIHKAVNKSNLVALTCDGNAVYRVAPMRQLEPIDNRSIYVANISPDSSHDSLRKYFSKYGEVLYVSIPKYLSTNDLRGFAFVDFATSENARCALRELRPKKKDDRKLAVWRYISRNNKQTRYLERSARKWEIDLSQMDDPVMDKIKNKTEAVALCALSKSSWLKYRGAYRSWQTKRNQRIRETVQNARDAFYTQNQFETEEPSEFMPSSSDNEPLVDSTPDDGYETQVSCASSGTTPSFTAGLILHLICENTVRLSKKKVKLIAAPMLKNIAYIDVIEGANECFLRSISSEASDQLLYNLDLSSCGGHLYVLKGEDEINYWKRVEASLSKKRANNTSKRKKRYEKKRKCDNNVITDS